MDNWIRMPAAGRFLLIASAWSGLAVLLLGLNDAFSLTPTALAVGAGCVFGAWVTLAVDLVVRHRFGSAEQFIAYRRALPSGELPAGANLDWWQRRLRGSTVANAFAGLWAAPLLWFGWSSVSYSQSPYRWAAAALFTSLTVYGFVRLCRRAAGVSRLGKETALQRRGRTQLDAVPVKAKSSWAETSFAAPLPSRFISSAMSGFLLAALVLLLADLGASFGWLAACAGVVGLLWGALGCEPHLRHDFSSFEQYAEFNQTVRTGTMPAAVAPTVWRRRLRGSARQNLLRALAATFLVGVGIAEVTTDPSPYHWVTAFLFQAAAIWLAFHWLAYRRRLAAVATAVDRVQL